MLLKNRYIQRLVGGGITERVGIRLASSLEYLLLSGHKDRSELRRIWRARWERRTLVTFNEAYLVNNLAASTITMDGDLAEIGVYEGSTARLLCALKGDKQLHLFDTFEGLPEGTTETEKFLYRKNQYLCSLESIQEYLKGFDNVHYYKGFFPDSAVDLDPDRKFCFVHMDVDLYQSTLDCLKFFYPRMLPGGIMLSHDYSVLAGVEQAFREFLADKPERLIELPTTQCMLIKR
ncbi:MAG: TylF/MycF/NovP-related O-methyltransferase [Pirellulaceae bacterium]|nr:class I SAM-dependent methyltransferase [Planctomycetales bacterium]MCA9219281.1 class I SAM-dependent methyltransferase [Planctomycetales bacterium]MCA9227847.1 class I SAM-dependent methyltransferase [Planctomycetales bacterium]